MAVLAVLLVAAGVFFYFSYDPAGGLFLKCPFKALTGWECAGCGSQRAIHHLLHGNLAGAWHMNPLLVAAIPYLILGIAVELPADRNRWQEWVRKHLYGSVAAWSVFAVIIIYMVLRNIF